MQRDAVAWFIRPWLSIGSRWSARVGRIYLAVAALTVVVLPAMLLGFGADDWLWDLTGAVVLCAPLGIALLDQAAELVERARAKRRSGRLPLLFRAGALFVGLAVGVLAGYGVVLALPGETLGADVLLADYRRNMIVLGGVVLGLGILGASLWYRGEAFRQKSAAAMANFAVLRAQTQPHFLFNALSSLKQLIAEDPARASDATQRLADLYRLILAAAREPTSRLADELAIVRSYLAIEHLRFGERLRYTIDAPDALDDVHVPSLVLQTLVENAVKHGIARARDGGEVRVEAARADDGRVALAVVNTGAPWVPDQPRAAGLPPPAGLAIARERLELMYGAAGALHIERDAPGTRVSFAVSGRAVPAR